MTGYELSRQWFNWCFDNQDLIKPNHTALYFFIIEHYNRMGQVDKFGLPTTMAKDAIGINSYNTYINTLNDLIKWGFVKLIKKSQNQYSSNIIALSKYNKATTKALDKALINHVTKQQRKQHESISSIIKQDNHEPITNNNKEQKFLILPFSSLQFQTSWNTLLEQKKWKSKSASAKESSLKLLSEYSEKDAIQMIENAIIGNWQGLFEIKGSKKIKRSTEYSPTGDLPF